MEEIREVAEIDLNNKTNRIPSEDELPRLRELVAKKSAIMDEIEAKINESTELQDDSLIKERDKLREAFSLLEGLIHPIRRAPDDILRYIFEWVYTFTEEPRGTEPFSQVSRHWREVAIATPSLFRNIRPPLEKARSIVFEYWHLAAKRVKSIPAIIKIQASPSRTAILKDLHFWCPLNIFPNIESLYIGLNDETILHIPNWLSKSSKKVNLLHFFHSYDTLPHNDPTFRDICAMASLVRPNILECPYLWVTLPTSKIEEKDMLPTVKTLHVRLGGSTSSLSEYFRAFPSLTSLRLYYCNLRNDGSPSLRIQLEKLKDLEINACGFPWGLQVDFPALETFHIIESPISPDLCDFIQTHKSIRKILIELVQHTPKATAPILSQLNQLMKQVNDSRGDARTELAIRVELYPNVDVAELNSLTKSEGISWTLVQDGNNRFVEHVWN